MTKEELHILEEVINEEILSILRSGYSLDDDSVVALRSILNKLGLKEIYNFESYREV